MHIILFDTIERQHLLPFAFTRPVAEMRIGILTIREKWQKALQASDFAYISEAYLQTKYRFVAGADNLMINGHACPNAGLLAAVKALSLGEALLNAEGVCLAARCDAASAEAIQQALHSKQAFDWSSFSTKSYDAEVALLTRPWQIFKWNELELPIDYELLTAGRKSAPLSKTNQVIAPENIFLEEGAIVEFATLNASNAKIYIARDAEVMEGSMIRGSFALGEHSQVKMGAKIYGATTIGPHSKVGGEINNCVIFGYSNKAHDGFMGNSVIGEWCNWGADTNNSNLKNNYEEVKLWSYATQRFEKTGLQFCGLMMGDHSKCGINTMFNTGTVVGVSANIFGAGFPRNIINDFSWGGAGGTMTYQLNKAIQTASLVYARRGLDFDATEQAIFEHIFNSTADSRKDA